MREKIKKLEEDEVVDFKCFSMKKHDGLYGARSGKYLKEFVSLDEIEDMAHTLLKVVEEIRNKDKFFNGENFYYVKESGYIESGKFYLGHPYVQACAFLGNIFKTEDEAESHKEEIMERFKEAREKYVAKHA